MRGDSGLGRSLLLGAALAALGAALAALGAAFASGHGEPDRAAPQPYVSSPSGYRIASAPYSFSFPRDHASHPQFQTEWWYYTGHLADRSRRYGYELTFFRVGLARERAASPSAWAAHTLYFAHFALTEETARRFRFSEAINRGSLGMAGADSGRYHVWIDSWSARLAPDGRTHELSARTPDYGIELALTPAKPPVVHGMNGVSLKAAEPGHASHYYSLTRLETRGTLVVGGRATSVTGLSWMDHEFATNALARGQRGWDWYALQLDDGREIMLYVLRDSLGRPDPASSGTLVGAGGETRHLPLASFAIETTDRWKSPKSGGVYPAGWIVRIPEASLELSVEPALADQELVTRSTAGVAYWEGSVRVSGRSKTGAISGQGYVELTGYAGRAPGF